MDLLKQEAYRELLEDLIGAFPDWGRLEGKGILISGASGMIGSLLVDALMLRNEISAPARRCRIFATGRSMKTAGHRFSRWMGKKEFCFFPHEITQPLDNFA